MSNLYCRQTKLRSSAGGVKGRIEYISDPKRQENILSFFNGMAMEEWQQLAEENRAAAAGRDNCIEAREFVVAFELKNKPVKELLDDIDNLAEKLVNDFTKTTGLPCACAVHLKGEFNIHAHIVFSEREKLQDPVEKVAERNLFFDESGKRVYKKGLILDENKELRPRCKIIKKGEVYERHSFAEKDERVSTKKFILDMKKHYAEMLGNTLFDYKSPFLAQSKIGKGNPNEELIREHNRSIKEYNNLARSYKRISGEDKKLQEYKSAYKNQPVHRRQNILLDILRDLRYWIKTMINEELRHRDWRKDELTDSVIATIPESELAEISKAADPPLFKEIEEIEKFNIEPEEPYPEYEQDQELEPNSENPDDDFEFR